VNLQRFSTLQLALGASIAVHAVLLTVRFVDPESFNRVFEDTPLEVILVNARTNEKPDKAKAIAQTSLAGGGDAEQGRATSPLPPSEVADAGETQDLVTASRLQMMQEQQNLLLSQIKDQLTSMAPQVPKDASNKPEQVEREEKRRQLEKLLAEIERRINIENSRPKKRYVSPATREGVHAVYYDAFKRAVEARGTENFPTANGKKIYGELTMIVTVNFDGRVLATEVVESSGKPLLDRRAAAIARTAGPFGPFPKAMRAQMDQLLVVSRFKFTRDETLEASLSSRP
jgi:protein TonB